MKLTKVTQLQDALFAIRGGRIPPLGSMPSLEKMKEILGFNSYYEEEKRYAIRASPLSSHIGKIETSCTNVVCFSLPTMVILTGIAWLC